jgi:hypothetical protein
MMSYCFITLSPPKKEDLLHFKKLSPEEFSSYIRNEVSEFLIPQFQRIIEEPLNDHKNQRENLSEKLKFFSDLGLSFRLSQHVEKFFFLKSE